MGKLSLQTSRNVEVQSQPLGLRCLSVRQPYVTLILQGKKTIELRTWKCHPTIRIALHASSQGKLNAALSPAVWPTNLVATGGIVGFVSVIDCRPTSQQDIHNSLVPVDGFRFSWILSDPIALREPIPHRGQLGLFKLSADVEALINAQI
jgi:activating signal cointegrator 1